MTVTAVPNAPGVRLPLQVLYSLRGSSTVTTFRTARLPDDMRRELAALRRQQQLEQQRQQQQAAASAAAAAGGEAGGRDGPGGERKPGELGAWVKSRVGGLQRRHVLDLIH